MRSLITSLSLLLCLSLLAAACGEDDPAPEPAPATTAAPQESPTTEAGPTTTEAPAPTEEPVEETAAEEDGQEEVVVEEETTEEPVAEPTNVAQEGHACIPPAAAFQEPAGSVVYVLNSLGSQNWLAPMTGFQSASVMMAMNEFLLCRDYQTGFPADGVGQLAKTWSVSEDWST